VKLSRRDSGGVGADGLWAKLVAIKRLDAKAESSKGR